MTIARGRGDRTLMRVKRVGNAPLNVLDRAYQLRDGGGIGVFAPQWAPRRGVYLSLQQDF